MKKFTAGSSVVWA